MRLALLPVFVWAVAAQTPDSRFVFDVATVRHGPVGDFGVGGTGCPGADPARCFVENYPLSSLLQMAYEIRSYQLSGPGWMDLERFTINAKAPEGTNRGQLSQMLRNLLIERFQIAAHFEKKQITGYQLVVAKGGAKLDQSPGPPKQDEDSGKDAPRIKTDGEGYPELPPGRHFMMVGGPNGRARWRFVDASMDEFVEKIADSMLQKPTANATGLAGRYDFLLSYSWAAMQPDPPPDAGASLFEALQQQLGLKLESSKVPMEILVIDHIEKIPRGN